MSDQVLQLVEAIQEWHENKIEQLNLIGQHSDASIKIGEHEIESGTDLHKGFRLGISIALEQFKELPFKLEKKTPKED